MTLSELINSMPGEAAATDQQVLDWLNEKQPAPVRYKDVRSYLHVTSEFPAILVSADPAARAMVDVLDNFDDVDLTNPVILNAITTQLDALVTVGLLSTGSKTAILALGDNKIERWKEQPITDAYGHLIRNLALTHVTEARS